MRLRYLKVLLPGVYPRYLLSLNGYCSQVKAFSIGLAVVIRHFFKRPETITAEQALDLLAQGNAVVVDVRRRADFQRNHIPGSIHIPLTELEDRALELPEDKLLITFCTGGLISSGAANLLHQLGFESVSMTRGLIDWRKAGGELQHED